MDINGRQHVGTEVAPPEGDEERIRLPGCLDEDKGVSWKQFQYIRNFALHDMALDAKTPWVEAREAVRTLLKVADNRPDFVLVTAIRRLRFSKVAANPLTEDQFDFLTIIIGACTGDDPHFNVAVQARVDQIPRDRRELLATQAMLCVTSGDMDRVVKRWNLFTGQMRGQKPTLPIPAGVGANLPPSNPGEEPF